MGTMRPTDPAWVTAGLLRASRKREVAASPEQVWSVISDPATWSTWYEGLDTFEPEGDEWGTGARFAMKEWLFRYQGSIVEFEPGRAIGYTFHESSWSWLLSRLAERVEIIPSADPQRCTVVHSGRFSPSLLGWLLASYTLGQTMTFMYFDYSASTKGIATLAEADS